MRPAMLVLLLTLQLGYSASPKLFKQRSHTSASLAEAVNYFVALGEEAAVQELRGLLSERSADLKRGYSATERVGWVCRILFEAKAEEPLRPPGFGTSHLPYRSMPLKSWPLFPVASSGSTFFVLSEGYTLFGATEDPREYLTYCRQTGVFRKTPVPVPSKAQALKDAMALKQSPVWKAIKWTDSGAGWSYTMEEGRVWEFILKQAEGSR